MRIKMNTTMAHPTLGIVHPGQIVELPDEDARPLLEGGNVSDSWRVANGKATFDTTPAATLVDTPAAGTNALETAAVEGAPESAMMPRARFR